MLDAALNVFTHPLCCSSCDWKIGNTMSKHNFRYSEQVPASRSSCFMATDLASSLYVNHISKITCKCLGEVYEFHHLRVARALFYNVTCLIWVARYPFRRQNLLCKTTGYSPG